MVLERRVQLKNAHGMHARPIAQVVAIAQAHQAELTIRCAGREADGRSILELMTLGAGPGAELELLADGADAAALLDAVEALVAAGFGEA